MANNQATIDKLAATNPDAMEFDASVDAIRFLQISPEMPPPSIHNADFGEALGIALQWTDEKRSMWCRAVFRGDGEFDWMMCGPPLDEDDPRPIDDDGGDIAVERGAPQSMADYINMMMRESA